jgi:predicted AlkP superfamily phosphohydrolase/phosphomutase
MQRVFVIGLDCADPVLVFERWRQRLPNLGRLLATGTHGELTSTIPAITVPAWSSMLSSRDPGQLGFYGFRNRADYSYERMNIATSKAVKADRVWDILSQAGKRVIVANVPQTYPVIPVNGCMISSFLTPTTQSQYTHPPALKQEIQGLLSSEYKLDVHNFRTENKELLLSQIYEMANQQHILVKHLMTSKPWDFFIHVDMGVDRMHHAFWKFFDERHPLHEPGSPYEHAIRDYYIHLDSQIGEWLDLLDDDTAVLVVSDHGGQPMMGGICFNEWLKKEGYLVLEHQPEGIVPLEKCEVDWSRTIAWGSGGYYARLFLNVKGREPEGIVDPADYEKVREELIERIAAIPEPEGTSIGSVAYRPEEVYRQIANIPPDLIVYLGALRWRSVGSLGFGRVHTLENDTGPDDANHAQEGLYIYHNPKAKGQGRGPRRHLMDVAPTILELMSVPIPPTMEGASFAAS